MSCDICGRNNCTRSFHSLEQQRLSDKADEHTKFELYCEVTDLRAEVEVLTEQRDELLEACQAAERSVGDFFERKHEDWRDSLADCLDCLRAAIAKAKGE